MNIRKFQVMIIFIRHQEHSELHEPSDVKPSSHVQTINSINQILLRRTCSSKHPDQLFSVRNSQTHKSLPQ